MCLGSPFNKVSDIASSSFSHQGAGQRFCCFLDGPETCWEHMEGVWRGKGWCCIYLWVEGWRGIAQYLFLIWQQKHSWFPSNFLEALSHTLTKLSLLSSSFVPSLEQDYPGKVQLEHREWQIQHLPGAVLCWRGCQAVASCLELVLGNQAPSWPDSSPRWVGTFLPNSHVWVKEAPRGVYQLISLRGEAFEGRTFLHRRNICVLLMAVGRCLCLGTLNSLCQTAPQAQDFRCSLGGWAPGWSSSLFSTLSAMLVELRNVYVNFGREKISPLPHTSIALRAYTVLRLNCTLWYHDHLTKA